MSIDITGIIAAGICTVSWWNGSMDGVIALAIILVSSRIKVSW